MSASRFGARAFRGCAAWLVAPFSLACGASSGPSDAAAELPDETQPGVPSEPTGATGSAGDQPSLLISELPGAASRTTPGEITLELHANLDHVGVRVYLNDVDENPISGCQQADIYRIGQDRVQWPIGDTFSIPLSYDAVLAPGVYTQSVVVDYDAGYFDVTGGASQWQYFEVSDGGHRPITSTEYSNIVMPVMYGPDGAGYYAGGAAPPEGWEPPPLPCDEPPPYSDEVVAEGSTTSVNLDSWVNVATRQPLRWVAPERSTYAADSGHSLEFRARSAAGQRLSLRLWSLAAEPPAELEVSLSWADSPDGTGRIGQGLLLLDEPDGTRWSSSGGSVRLRRGEGDQMSVLLSDLVLDSQELGTGPVVSRGVRGGSIAGTLIRE